MTQLLIKRGGRPDRRHAHIARYNAAGTIVGAFCPVRVDSGWISSNVPWGLRTCAHCLNAWRKVAS